MYFHYELKKRKVWLITCLMRVTWWSMHVMQEPWQWAVVSLDGLWRVYKNKEVIKIRIWNKWYHSGQTTHNWTEGRYAHLSIMLSTYNPWPYFQPILDIQSLLIIVNTIKAEKLMQELIGKEQIVMQGETAILPKNPSAPLIQKLFTVITLQYSNYISDITPDWALVFQKSYQTYFLPLYNLAIISGFR